MNVTARRHAVIVATALVLPAWLASRADAATLNMYNYNTNAGGTNEVSSFSNDGDGSLHLATTAIGKAAEVFGNYDATAGGLSQLGTLGNLSSVTAEFYKSASGSDPTLTKNQFAYRVILNPTDTLALVWENNYNANGDVPTGSWQQEELVQGGSGVFWQAAPHGSNYTANGEPTTLTQWDTGTVSYTTDDNGNMVQSLPIDSTTGVYGLEVAYGSYAGTFDGYVDNIGLTFGSGPGAQSFTANVTSVPEPATLGIAGLAAVGLLGRRRRRR